MSVSARLKDVAEAAGVDISTASTILAKKPKAARFAEATRLRIFEAARKLNYQPNAAARALATHRTGSIGLTLHSEVPRGWANLYFAGQLVGVEEVCRTRGYGLQINLYDLNDVKSFVFPRHVQQRAVDGVILAGWVRSGIISKFKEFGIPIVCIGDNHDVREQVPSISVNHVSKALEAVHYAASLGHRNIGYFALPSRQKSEIANRVHAAVEADPSLQEINFRTFIQESSSDIGKSGREVLDQVALVAPKHRPTVLIFTTLDLSIGVLKAMRSRGLRCPEDLSIIADNDDDLCEITEPPLTAMGQDLQALGRIAANELIDQLEGKESPAISPLPPLPLKIRGSVANLNRL
jgi:LacI family transcriptional regulator